LTGQDTLRQATEGSSDLVPCCSTSLATADAWQRTHRVGLAPEGVGDAAPGRFVLSLDAGAAPEAEERRHAALQDDLNARLRLTTHSAEFGGDDKEKLFVGSNPTPPHRGAA
jgi:hypothetical protein